MSENDPATVLFPELLGPVSTVTGAILNREVSEKMRKLPSNNPLILSILEKIR
jgi:hypothetical protein